MLTMLTHSQVNDKPHNNGQEHQEVDRSRSCHGIKNRHNVATDALHLQQTHLGQNSQGDFFPEFVSAIYE